jgi:hypothetical protein
MFMSQITFEIDGQNFDDFEGFIREFNRVFESETGGSWQGNLDAFNDYLSWPKTPYIIKWRRSWKSRRDLGYDAIIVWYLRAILEHVRPSESSWWDQLDAARKQEGPTLFDWLIEIIGDNAPHVTLELDDGV